MAGSEKPQFVTRPRAVTLRLKPLQFRAADRLRVAADPLADVHGRGVYFISDGNGHVKIGYAADIRGRFSTIQLASPDTLTLIGWDADATRADEKAWHRSFRDHRLRGEWFQLPPDALSEIPHVSRPSRLAVRLYTRANEHMRGEAFSDSVAAIVLYELADELEQAA